MHSGLFSTTGPTWSDETPDKLPQSLYIPGFSTGDSATGLTKSVIHPAPHRLT